MSEDIFKKRKEFMRQFEQLPETIIAGVVGFRGAGGGRFSSEKLWHFTLSLIAWREIGSNVNHSKLMVYKEDCTRQELQDIQNAIKVKSLVSFRAKLLTNSPYGDWAQLISLLETPVDKELEEILYQYQQEVKIDHPIFGGLTLNRSANSFQGEAKWLGKNIQIDVTLDEDGSPNSSIETAMALWDHMDEWSQKVNQYALSQLLERRRNDNWLGEDESELNADDFLNAMTLDLIVVYPDGWFAFW